MTESERHQLELRRLRYYARFLMVCLLSGKLELLQELHGELRGLIKGAAAQLSEQELQSWQEAHLSHLYLSV